MTRFAPLSGSRIFVALLVVGMAGSIFAADDTANPFANSTTPLPPGYAGPKFELSHNYPTALPNPPRPTAWKAALGGNPITKATAGAYCEALKAAISADMQVLIGDYPNWNAADRGWYNQPWLQTLREPIYGAFTANDTPASLFTHPSPDKSVVKVNDWGVVYYDATAAVTLGGFWGSTAMKPNLTTAAGQFAEGSLIVKLAFTQVNGGQWSVMKDSPQWNLYSQEQNDEGKKSGPDKFFPVHLLQLDIIVKDSEAAPKTGWVYSTLVFDNTVQGDFWARMVPLGAMWGNDPDVNSTENPTAPLNETWINPAAPAYSKDTLGWGGRLSGPNDGGVAAAGSYIDAKTGKPGTVNQPNSSCMSCHSPAQWNIAQKEDVASLLPGTMSADHIYYMAAPGSKEWMQWFQDRPGTQPMNEGSIALDYDMMFAFKSLGYWSAAVQPNVKLNKSQFMRPQELRRRLGDSVDFNYRGFPKIRKD